MPVKFFKEDTSFDLKGKSIIKDWIKNVILSEKRIAGSINYIFTSDEYLLCINNKYLSHNFYTDIITFNYCEKRKINGDIFISIDTVKNNSKRFDVLFMEELNRVMVHGVLHLIGYDDKNEEQKNIMREKENHYLERLKKLS